MRQMLMSVATVALLVLTACSDGDSTTDAGSVDGRSPGTSAPTASDSPLPSTSVTASDSELRSVTWRQSWKRLSCAEGFETLLALTSDSPNPLGRGRARYHGWASLHRARMELMSYPGAASTTAGPVRRDRAFVLLLRKDSTAKATVQLQYVSGAWYAESIAICREESL